MCRNLRSQVNKRCATGIRCLILLGIPLKRPNSGRLDCNRTCVSLNFEQKIFQCSEEGCSKKFSSKAAVKYHLKHNHNLGKDNAAMVKGGSSRSNVPSSEVIKGKFACSHPGCSKSYNVRSYLVQFLSRSTC